MWKQMIHCNEMFYSVLLENEMLLISFDNLFYQVYKEDF